MLVHHRVTPSINLAVPIYTPGWRRYGESKLSCLTTEQNVSSQGLIPDGSIKQKATTPSYSLTVVHVLYQNNMLMWLHLHCGNGNFIFKQCILLWHTSSLETKTKRKQNILLFLPTQICFPIDLFSLDDLLPHFRPCEDTLEKSCFQILK